MKRREREEARELRRNGMSVKKIASKVGASPSVVSLWVRDILLTEEQKESLPNATRKEGKFFRNLSTELLEKMIGEGLSQKKMAERFNVSCSFVSRIFKQRGLDGKTRRGPEPRISVCKVCGNNNQGKSWRGCLCFTCNSKIRRVIAKMRAVRELGGKCQRCGWVPTNREIVAMEFHHKKNSNKEFIIGKKLNYGWDKILKEIRKCELLCSRCHRIEHSKRDDVLEYVLRQEETVAEK